MKKLVLCRHAKSSWKVNTDDLYRPLNRRGIEQAPQMANEYLDQIPDLVISSIAVRAYSTALAYFSELQWPLERLRLEKKLFHGDLSVLLEVLREVDESVEDLWVFGHNPGLNLLGDFLTGKTLDNLVTSGRLSLTVNIDSWIELSEKCSVIDSWKMPKPIANHDH